MESIKTYLKESYEELVNRVTWPTWKDLQNSAVVVAVASMIIALVIGLMDISSKLLLNDFLYKLVG
jgi:preprotein translocase subunit SecE